MEDPVCWMSLHELSGRIRRREITPLEVAEAHLRRIEAINPKIMGFLTMTADLALEEARRAGEEIAAGCWRGPLHGVPYGAKDIIDTAGVRTTNGSSFFRDHVPAEDAECIARLRRAGAVLLGKCHTHEFAAGGTTINPHYGTTRNPWNLDRIVGGSSGGSAASVAAGLCPAALGTDTGGSIRTPAAFCGVVGLKPTHGRVSLTGVCPNVLSLDHVGPMARSTHDAALLLQAIAGYDPRDTMSRDAPVPDYTAGLGKGMRGTRLALSPDFYNHAEMDDEVANAFGNAVGVFRDLGAEVEILPFSDFNRMERAYMAIRWAEFAEFHRPFYEKNPEGYGKDVRGRVETAQEKARAGDYVRALRERELLRRGISAFFRKVDALLLPSHPFTAPPLATLRVKLKGEDVDFHDSHRSFLSPHNLTGCPAVSLPMGFSGEGLPLSLQIVGPYWGEAEILRFAHAYEEATPEVRSRRPACA